MIRFKKRITAFMLIIMAWVFSFFDAAFYRPMEAYAAFSGLTVDAVSSGGYGSLVADLARAFGIDVDKASALSYALDMADFIESRRKEICEEQGIPYYKTWREYINALKLKKLDVRYRTYTHTSEDGTVHGGVGATFQMTGATVMEAGDFLDSVAAGEDVAEVPRAFFDMARAWAVEKLNISAADGSAPVKYIYLSPAAYYDANYTRLNSLVSDDGRFTVYSGGAVWIARYYSGGRWTFAFWGTPGTTVRLKDTVKGTDTECFTLPDSVNNAGYSTLKWSDVSGMPARDYFSNANASIIYLDSFSDLDKASFAVAVIAAGSSVDIPLYNDGAITWNGNRILDATLAAQNSADSIDDYLARVLTNTGPVELPTEAPSESAGTGTGEGDVTLSGILSWLSKLYNGIISLPGSIASSIASGWTKVTDAISAQTVDLGKWLSTLSAIKDAVIAVPRDMAAAIADKWASVTDAISAQTADLGKWISTVPGILADIRDKVTAFPDNVSKELAKIRENLDTFPAALADIRDTVTTVPKDTAAALENFFTLDTARLGESCAALAGSFRSRFPFLEQLRSVFSPGSFSFPDTIPVIRMSTPDALRFAIKEDEIIVMDLRPFAEEFAFARGVITAFCWLLFAVWLLNQSDVKFHIG